MSVLSKPYMHDETATFAHVESIIWPEGPVCPHCSVVDRAYRLEGVRSKPSKKNPEGIERHGLWKCRECRKLRLDLSRFYSASLRAYSATKEMNHGTRPSEEFKRDAV